MTAVKVTRTNLLSESRTNVVGLITRANVSDPTTSSAEYRKWIYSRDPDTKANDFAGYPFIIVHPTDMDIEEGVGSLDGKSKVPTWDIEVEIVSSDRGYSKNDGKGLTHMDSICDALLSTFMDITNRKTLSDNSMFFTMPTTSAVSTSVLNNELVYRRSIMLSFRGRLQVSA